MNTLATTLCSAALVAGLALGARPAGAQVSDRTIDRAVAVTVDSFVVLAEGPGIHSGRFRFPNDITIELTRLPFGWSPARAKPDGGAWTTAIRPWVRGGIGSLRATERGRLSNGATIELETDALAASIAGGAHVDIAPRWTVSAGVGVAYAQVENQLKTDATTRALLDPWRGRLFDWKLDTLSVLPSLSLTHDLPDVGAFRSSITLGGTYLGTWVVADDADVDYFHTNSGIFSLRATTEGPIGASLFDCPLAVRPSVERVQLVGDFERGLDVNGYFGFGLDLFARTTAHVPFVSEIGIGGSVEIGDHLRGWSVGIVFSAHF